MYLCSWGIYRIFDGMEDLDDGLEEEISKEVSYPFGLDGIRRTVGHSVGRPPLANWVV